MTTLFQIPVLQSERFWLAVGLVSQVFFFLRFFVQWVVSEQKKESRIPVSFWYFSILGGVGLLLYSIYRKDPVFIAGQSMGILIYSRNLYFVRKKSDENL